MSAERYWFWTCSFYKSIVKFKCLFFVSLSLKPSR